MTDYLDVTEHTLARRIQQADADAVRAGECSGSKTSWPNSTPTRRRSAPSASLSGGDETWLRIRL